MSKTNTKKATSPNEEKKNRTDRFIDGAKDFINFANLGLVVQIYWSIEKGYLLICELCHCITLTCMNKWRDLCTRTKKKNTITLFTPKASLFQQNTNHNLETKQTYDFGRWALVTKATASTTTTKTATSKTTAATSVSATSKTTATAPTAPASRWSHGSVIKQREWVVSVAPELYTIERERGAVSQNGDLCGVLGEKGLGF